MNRIVINKNRGWRGLAEVIITDDKGTISMTRMFSFSRDVWDDLMYGYLVIQDGDYYYVLTIDNTDKLPQGQQRSVLIKNFTANVTKVNKISKDEWGKADTDLWLRITHFRENSNYYTQSDWNCVGIRVTPTI